MAYKELDTTCKDRVPEGSSFGIVVVNSYDLPRGNIVEYVET